MTPEIPYAHDKPARRQSNQWSARALKFSGISWFLVAAIGQWVFVYYVAAAYVPKLAVYGFPGLRDTALPNGYVQGDFTGNLAISAHVLIAIIIIGGGPLQLMAPIRNRFPTFHRYVGRIYMSTAVLTSLAGAYLIWTRGTVGDIFGHLAVTLDAILIISFAAIAVRYAIRRDIDRHRRWAMRLFMVASAVWFFRISLMFWFMTTGGLGVDTETFTGPAIVFLNFGQMFIPLAVLQFYFTAQDRNKAVLNWGAAMVVLIATAITAIGSFAAAMGMWFPRL